MEQINQYAIIVAGGNGSRMNAAIPKQFLELEGLPVLMHAIKRFLEYSPAINIILVLPKDQMAMWETLVKDYNFTHTLTIAPGGKSRFESVKNGLAQIKEDEALVAIHDGVRPCISKEIIQEGFSMAALYGSAVTSVALKESIRIIKNESNEAADRNMFRLIQTPQTFRFSLLKEAYNTAELPHFTDDASVVENAGHTIHLIEGSYKNLKITLPEDKVVAECFLKGL